MIAFRARRPHIVRTLQLALIVLAAAALVSCGGSSPEGASTAPAAVTTSATAVVLASPTEAQALIDAGDVLLLDVRTPEEFAEGHLAGAENIDFYATDFADQIGALDPDKKYVVYCRSGNRSGQATSLMAEQGFTTVADVDGGIVAWEAAGLPTVATG